MVGGLSLVLADSVDRVLAGSEVGAVDKVTMPIITRKYLHEVEEKSKLYFLLNSFIGAYNRRTDVLAKSSGGNNSDVLTAINNLTILVKEKFMGLKEDFQTLQGKFDGLESASLAVADDIAALKNEISEANDRANIDLSPLMARADKIEAGLRSAAGPQAGSDPAAPPVDPPVDP